MFLFLIINNHQARNKLRSSERRAGNAEQKYCAEESRLSRNTHGIFLQTHEAGQKDRVSYFRNRF